MPTRYRYAPEVEKIGKELIREHHRHLTNVEVRFVFTDTIQRRGGKETWGTARKVGSLAAFLAGQDDHEAVPNFFVISITEPIWSYLPPEKRRALVDHELCFPAGTEVTGPAPEGSMVRRYTGKMVEISTTSGRFLAGTPNHPILTPHGWMRLDHLKIGDDVISSRFPERMAAAMDPNKYQVKARIEEVAGPRRMVPGSMPATAHDLDPYLIDRQINVERANRFLLDGVNPSFGQHVIQVPFGNRDAIAMLLPGGRHLAQGLLSMSASEPCSMSPLGKQAALIGRKLRHAVSLRRASISNLNPILLQDTIDRFAVDGERLLQQIRGVTSDVAADKIIRINIRPFSGQVYNLQTKQGWYSANGIVTHNCHCWIDPDHEGETPKLVLVGHDLEEFVQVIQRHGLWRDDVQKFVEVGSPLLQNSLFDADEGAEGAEVPETSGDRRANEGPLERRGIVLGGPPKG